MSNNAKLDEYLRQPFAVGPNGKSYLAVMQQQEALPAAYMLLATQALDKSFLRFDGGASGMALMEKIGMLDYMGEATDGYRGVVSSGGTRQTAPDGRIDPMVCDILAGSRHGTLAW